MWDEPPWEPWLRRGRGRWRPPEPWEPEPFPGPADLHENEEDRRWAAQDCPPPPPWEPEPFPGPADFCENEDRRWAAQDCPPPPYWNDGLEIQGPEDGFREDWPPPGAWDHRPFPEPANVPWNEEDTRWEDDYPLPPPWDDREENQGPEDHFREGWYLEPLQPGPRYFPWTELPDEEQHLHRPPARLPGERGSIQDGCPSRPYRDGKRLRRFRRDHRELTLVQRLPCPWPSRGKMPPSRSSPSLSGMSQPGVKEEKQPPATRQPLPSSKPDAQSREQTAQGLPAGRGKVTEPPQPADTPLKSPDTCPQAVMEAAEPEQAAGATEVQAEAAQTPVGSHSQGSSALETEPASPKEENSASTGQHLKVEPCSQSVPKAGAGGGSHPHDPTAAPEPPEKVCSDGGVDAELCPRSQGQQHLPSASGETKAEAANHELPGSLQPSENPQVTPGATTEPDVQPSQDSCDTSAVPETSPGTQHPPGSSEKEPAAGSRRQLCSTPLAPSLPSTDLRSAAVLARKEEIELSYQQFSLTIAVVATMLLQKEPSMERALGLALRANLRQGRIHHLQELEDFINSYDSANLSC